MATCIGCSLKVDEPIQRQQNAKYTRGDVYGLKESVYTPIYDILQDKSSNLGNSYAARRSRRSLASLATTPDVIPKPRPAIIMQDQDDDQGGLMVCLTTRYASENIKDLPRIFRHFSIPIAPHDRIVPGHLGHMHSHPRWGKNNAWVIARPFLSNATRDGVWADEVDGEQVPYVFDEDTMGFLAEECDRKLEEWTSMCQDVKLAATLEGELRRHVRDRPKQKHVYGGTGNRASTTSFDSLGAGIDGPNWRSAKRSTTTILEETDNNVVPETAGNAAGWKVAGGSTYSLASTARRKRKDDTDNLSMKSKRSQLSFAQKTHNGSGLFNFDILRAVMAK